jgi:hypothetical protein
MNRNQHNARENSINPGLSSAEIERKWRLLKEEQDRMELMEAIANVHKYAVASVTTGSFFPYYSPEMFVTTWDTTLISTGSSTGNQIRLPLISTGSYSFFVDWGDGTSSIITSWNQAETTHTYSNTGRYTVIITGALVGWRFAGTGDILKIISVEQWGSGFRLGATDQHFNGCANLSLIGVRDVLNLTGTTSFASSFAGCSQLTTINRSNEWNTSEITSLLGTFQNSFNFNSDIGNWDTTNVTSMFATFSISNTLARSGSFNKYIGNWNTSKVTTLQATFSNQSNFNQDISTKVVTNGASTYTAWDTSNVISMFGTFYGFTNMIGTFNQNIGNWNTSKVTNMQTLFQNQPLFNQDISTKVVTVGGNTYTAWDTKEVNNMLGLFFIQSGIAGMFNQNIGNWNTSKVTTINSLLTNHINFNQDISTKVVTVGGNTYTAWDTKEVNNMGALLGVASISGIGKFNQNIGNWNTSKVTSLAQVFLNQPLFNQDISTKVVTVGASTYTAWDTVNVTTMSSFLGMTSGLPGNFNQNIGNWNTSKVTNINSIFQNNPAFNQNVSTKTVTVGASTYTAWDMLNVTTMRYAFYNNLGNTASQFNQNIGNWNTIKVTDMTAMLFNTANFNQNIGNWRVNLVTAFNNTGAGIADTFADYNGLSTANYDALLIGWASRPVRPNILINFGTTKYSSAAVAARSILTSAPNNWTIIDGGQI